MKPALLPGLHSVVALSVCSLLGFATPSFAAPPESRVMVTSYAPVLARVIPSVVTVRVVGETLVPVQIQPLMNGTKPDAVLKPEKEKYRAGGSGVIVDAERGHILTNNHVIADATWIQVVLSNGRHMLAEIVGRDIGTDLALLRVKEKGLSAIAVGDSDAMEVGDVVLAVGNPFGLEGTATKGIISAMMRTDVGHGAFEDFLQIDASINPGNSGGALVNANGELIGINTAGPAAAGSASGIGFAIPINQAMLTMRELVTAGRVRRGSPGMVVEDLPSEVAELKNGTVIKGAMVAQVLPKSAAAEAGIKAGDIIVSAANKPVRSAAEYITRTVTVPLGTTIPFIFYSHGVGRAVSLEAKDVVFEPERRTVPATAGSMSGAVVGEILLGNPLYGDVRGAQILALPKDSPAYAAGLEVDDVIVEVDGGGVRSVDRLLQRLARAGQQYSVKIIRDGVPGLVRATR